MSDLTLVFRPRFWGSFESRHAQGKRHLRLRRADRTLCGEWLGEAEPGTALPPGQAIPKSVCKRCQKSAGKLG